jgi:peptide/nickel transport system substrate-binding protein
MEGSMSDTSQNPSAQARIGALLEGLGAGRIGRREFLAGAAALGLSTGAATSLMTRTARAATPKRGGHLRVGTDGGATIDTFDPMQTIGTDHITNSVLSCYDSLTEIDGTGTPVPSLAESWDTSKDGKTWTFKLRKGTEFHNGKSLTADDVIWSLNLHLSESNKFAEGKQIVSSLEELKADGKDTVVMVQKEVNYDLPAISLHICPPSVCSLDPKGQRIGTRVSEPGPTHLSGSNRA